jgi:hypothetical protein
VKNYWPIRDNDGTPIGSTKDDETGRLLVSPGDITQADGETFDTIDLSVRELLELLLLEQRETNYHLRILSGEKPAEPELEPISP